MQKNLGVIIEQKDSDYIAGTLPYEVLNPLGDWTPYLPKEENQYTHHTDSQACITFSILNVLETIYKFKTGKDINFSDRFIAKLSGTTPQGNTVQKVLDTIRKYGLVLESEWPTNWEFDWNEYYAEVPPYVLVKAQKFDISYEFIQASGDIGRELKQSPLEVIIEATNPYHSQELVKPDMVFDTYAPFLKPLKTPYIFTKILLKLKPMSEFIHIFGTETYGLEYTTDFVTTIVKFTSREDAKEKLKNIPGALNADGSVNFNLAKEIRL